MEGIEEMNKVIVHPNQRAEFTQYNSYIMNVDQGNKNCYNCRDFGHLVRNCRNRGNRIGEGRRLEYRERRIIEERNRQNNLNREGDLIVLD